MWYYKTTFGTFKIKQQSNGYYGLWLSDELLGSYPSPEAAADDVYTQSSGAYEWDDHGPITDPTDLSEWQRFG
jgi:hypothetical protein